MKSIKEKIYCSLDIETSDFDPSIGDLLELGMSFFVFENGKIKILQDWQSTFKPAKEVPPRILALTGITQEELDASVLFSEKREEVQRLVQDVVIVGHNINFDTKFLEAFGIKFSGKWIDTLDLAQVLLPTHTSYNLEAMMNFCEVEHKDAHRALADAKAAIVVLERLLQHHASFESELNAQLQKILDSKETKELAQILSYALEAKPLQAKKEEAHLLQSPEVANALRQPNAIICFPLGYDHHSYVYGALKKIRTKTLLVLPSKKAVYQLWQQGLAYPIFDNRDLFNPENFEKNLKKAASFEQRLFFAKICVWQRTNWQASVISDINFSFYGAPFRSLISYKPKQELKWNIDVKQKIIAVDYVDFINMNLGKALSGRKVVILDLNNFEQALTYVTSCKVSWNDFIYSLKQVYDPYTKFGKKEFAELVEQAYAQVDLFFGLAMLHWKRIDNVSPNITVNNTVLANSSYEIIKSAALNLCDKISEINEQLNSERLAEHVSHLRKFFSAGADEVRWAEIGENRLAFMSSPISLEKISAEKLGAFPNITFTASLGSDSLIKYFVHRLNLKHFSLQVVGQQELRPKFEVIIAKQSYETKDILNLLGNSNYPTALLLPNVQSLKNFYETNFKSLQERFKVCAQSYSGGTTKLLENFGINENSLLIATDTFLLKQYGRRLKVKTLILTRLPFEQFTHPLFAAQAQNYDNQFLDFNIPRALYNFHSLIKFFYGPELEKVYILDPKIHKEYGKYFVEYLKSLPFVELVGGNY